MDEKKLFQVVESHGDGITETVWILATGYGDAVEKWRKDTEREDEPQKMALVAEGKELIT